MRVTQTGSVFVVMVKYDLQMCLLQGALLCMVELKHSLTAKLAVTFVGAVTCL